MDERPQSLAQQIAAQIVGYIKQQELEPGERLVEQRLAHVFAVSRSPVRDALEFLEIKRIVERRPHRGFFLKVGAHRLGEHDLDLARPEEPTPYLRIAEDRLASRLPEQFSETDLMRRYGARRAQIQTMLGRMAQEGWVERRRGYGWQFLPILTSSEAYEQSYRFRIAIEPAALMEPTYRIDQAAFARARARMQALLDGQIHELSAAELFQIGSEFHEMIVGCSGNPFFLEALRRQNRLRRLIEYRAMVDTGRFLRAAREHLELLDRLEAGERADAARFLRRHLSVVRRLKTTLLKTSTARLERAAMTF